MDTASADILGELLQIVSDYSVNADTVESCYKLLPNIQMVRKLCEFGNYGVGHGEIIAMTCVLAGGPVKKYG
jgi:hypothetical protein